MIPTGRQLREGRALIGMSQVNLAQAAKRPVEVVIRAESDDGLPMVRRVDSTAIQRVLEAAGVEFIPGGADVKLRKTDLE